MAKRGRRNPHTLHSSPELCWSHVNKGDADACWCWIGARSNGYGNLHVRQWYDANDRKHVEWKKAHRRAWELSYGAIPEGLSVLHRCDNPPCVRPDHLFLGTRADNAHDRTREGRTADHHGVHNPNVKLTPEDVLMIRKRYAEDGDTQQELADRFGVKQAYVSNIILRKAWRNL